MDTDCFLDWTPERIRRESVIVGHCLCIRCVSTFVFHRTGSYTGPVSPVSHTQAN